MAKQSSFDELSANVQDRIRELVSRIDTVVSGERMWERLLTEADRRRLRADFETSYTNYHGPIGIWMKAKGVAWFRACIDIGLGLGFLRQADADWLLREAGELQPPQPDRPSWNADVGELRLGKQVIREVRVCGSPTNIQKILDAFEAAGWPPRINNPLPGGDQQQLHQTLYSLNRKLRKICFRAAEGAAAVTWSVG